MLTDGATCAVHVLLGFVPDKKYSITAEFVALDKTDPFAKQGTARSTPVGGKKYAVSRII